MKKTDRSAILDAYASLRVADVRDGMDTMGLHDRGTVSPDIRPLWRTRACGIARTCRYVAYDGPKPDKTGDEYWKWVGEYYEKVCPYPWIEEIQPGDFIVIDQSELSVGLMGSCNTLDVVKRGARGLVSNGGVRDTDEIILQKIPFWSRCCSQTMVQCRLKFGASNIPVTIGGVEVCPGDVVVADGDGVIVVPAEQAMDVAAQADAEHKRDMRSRRQFYEALGLERDGTV